MSMLTRCATSIVVIGLAVSCASEPAVVTSADYLESLDTVCTQTATTIDALPQPPDQITVADFATSAANTLEGEAERVRALDAPDELEADHRAFIRNTDEQAATWRSIATAGDDQLDQLTVGLGELIRGRNDLADEMNAPGCRRGDV